MRCGVCKFFKTNEGLVTFLYAWRELMRVKNGRTGKRFAQEGLGGELEFLTLQLKRQGHACAFTKNERINRHW